MTPQQAKELLPIITAFANNEEIQTNVGKDNKPEWCILSDLGFTEKPSRYRIKPPQPWYRVYQYTSGTATLNTNSGCTEQWVENRQSFIKWLTDKVYY